MSDDEIRPAPSSSRKSPTGLMRWYRYIPLGLLMVGVVAMAGIGTVVNR